MRCAWFGFLVLALPVYGDAVSTTLVHAPSEVSHPWDYRVVVRVRNASGETEWLSWRPWFVTVEREGTRIPRTELGKPLAIWRRPMIFPGHRKLESGKTRSWTIPIGRMFDMSLPGEYRVWISGLPRTLKHVVRVRAPRETAKPDSTARSKTTELRVVREGGSQVELVLGAGRAPLEYPGGPPATVFDWKIEHEDGTALRTRYGSASRESFRNPTWSRWRYRLDARESWRYRFDLGRYFDLSRRGEYRVTCTVPGQNRTATCTIRIGRPNFRTRTE